MTAAQLSPFVLAVLALVAPRALRRLQPATAARITAVALAGAALSALSSLGLMALSAIVQFFDGHERYLVATFAEAHTDPPTVVGLAAGGVLLVALVRAGRVLWGADRERRRHRWGRCGVVIADDDSVYAYAVPGVAARVVLSGGLVRLLSPEEVDACVAHERAHLLHRHHLYALLAELCAVTCPWLRPAAARSQFLLERWADEDAAVTVGDRRAVARAIARAALERHGRPLLAFSGRFVQQRVVAMMRPRPALPRVLDGAALAASAILSVAMSMSALQLKHVVAFI